MSRTDLVAILGIAEQQLGLVSTQQLRDLGMSPTKIRGLVASGQLTTVRRAVHLVAGAPTGPHQRLLAATLAAGPGAVASHGAAAWLWRFDGVRPTGIELSVPRDRNPSISSATVHRVRDLLPVDVRALGPQPVTTAARTLLDIASLVPAARLEEAFDGARRRGQVHLPFLEWRLGELRGRGRPGVSALHDLLQREHTSDKAESWLESAFLRIIRDSFLPPPRVQVVRRTPGGGRRARLDAFYDDQRLVAEVGGQGSHATRRQRQADAERRARLGAMGLRVVDFTYEDVQERPHYVASTLGGYLGLEPVLDAFVA